MRRIRLAILVPLTVCGACTELKAVVATTPSASPSTAVVTAGSPVTAFPTASPSPAATGLPTNPPVILPTLRPGTQAVPEPSFTPAIIVPLGGFKTPVPCPSSTKCASPAPSATPTFAPGVTPPPSPNVSPLPGASPTPKPTGTPFPALNGIPVLFTAVAGAAIDRINNLWLGDADKKTVVVYTLDGAKQGTYNVDGPPGAIAFDKDGNGWVQSADLATLVELDPFGNRIDKYTLTVAATGIVGRPGLSAVPTGGMWVANGGGANTVIRVDDKGKTQTTIEAENGIAAIAADAGGNVWVVGSARGTKLSKFSPTGTPLGVFDDTAGLEDPKAAKIDKNGNLWVIGRRTVVPQPTEGFVLQFAGTGARISTISTGVDRFPVAFDFGPQGDLVIANGPNGLSTEHAGFQRVTAAAGVKVEKAYNAPTDVVVDRNGDVWGINKAREAFRFKL